jgi:elongation factor P
VISTSDFKKGVKILFKDEPYMVLEYHYVKSCKGGAFVRTKMKNMITGLVYEERFRSGEKFPEPNLDIVTCSISIKTDCRTIFWIKNP